MQTPIDTPPDRLDPKRNQWVADQIARAEAHARKAAILEAANRLNMPVGVLNSIVEQYRDPATRQDAGQMIGAHIERFIKAPKRR